MKILKNEKYILNLIKYGPILFVIIFSFVITQVFLYEKNEDFHSEINKIEKTFLENNKNKIKEEVDRVYTYIIEEKEKSEKLLKEEIKNRVYEAHNLATNIYTQESKKDEAGHFHSKEHIFETIKTALGGIIYNNGRGYFFMDDITGVKLLQPLNREFEGKNLLEYEDAKGYKFVKKIVLTIKNKTEAYDSYYWFKANDKNTSYKKISFYKYFEPYNVAIGTGEYVKDFENELKVEILDNIRRIRFGKDGYIFAYDLNGINLSHYNKELIGVNRINVRDKDGNYIVKDGLNLVKEKKSTYFSYLSSVKPGSDLSNRKKISYLKLVEDWGWMIGSGFYLDDLNDEIEQRKELLEKSNNESIKKIIIGSILVTMLFIFVSFYVSRIIKNRFDEYNNELKKEIDKTIDKEKMLIQQSKMATMGEMIGNIAHQWKQPLSLISTSNGLLRLNREFGGTFQEKDIDNAIVAIDDSVQNLSQTIDDFRNFFSPNKEEEFFNIKHTFEKTFNLIMSQFKNNNIEVIQNIRDVNTFGLENELLQVLINILKNAKEELVKKGTSDKKYVFIDVYKKDKTLIIKIKDNAGGIPKDIIDKVFDNYFTTKEDIGGTGIGLYMSKQIIEKNNFGNIYVENKDYMYKNVSYRGAEFIIEVPIST